MEEAVFSTAKAVLGLGTDGLLIYFLIVLWNDKKEVEKRKDGEIDIKDKIIEGMYTNSLDIIKNNTEAQSKLASALDINTEVLRGNLKAQETLTDKVYDFLTKR